MEVDVGNGKMGVGFSGNLCQEFDLEDNLVCTFEIVGVWRFMYYADKQTF
jgi:hypothetical protein